MDKETKIRIALCGIQEEVNTFAVESMGFATVTGNMATGFQRFEGQAMIDEYKGTSTWPGGWVDAFLEQSDVEFIVWRSSGSGRIDGSSQWFIWDGLHFVIR